jgi:hypothetical protein
MYILHAGAEFDRKYDNGFCNLRLHGASYHRIGSMLPDEGQPAQFLQLYMWDSDHEVNTRIRYYEDLKPELVEEISHSLRSNNPFLQLCKEAVRQNETQDVHISIKADFGELLEMNPISSIASSE